MNHLPTPVDPVSPLLDIPYICDDDDLVMKCCWAHYPDDKNWLLNHDGKTLSRPMPLSATKEEASIFLQAWLYFGVLAEVFSACDIVLQAEWFVKSGITGLVLSTVELPRLLDEMFEREKNLPHDIRVQHHRRVWRCLNIAGKFAFLLRDDPDVPIQTEIRLANSILGESLSNAASVIWADIPAEPSWFFRPIPGTVDRMIELRWCRSDVNMLHHAGMGLTAGCYLASRLKPGRLQAQRRHVDCSDQQCLARQIDETTYKTKHAADGCDCSFLAVDGDGVSIKLFRGVIPRVRVLKCSQTGKTSIKAVGHGSGPYVAISHVWSDGLGNSQLNALPTCQVSRLRDIVAGLYSEEQGRQYSIPFWLDTLCIPLEAEARKISLNLLARTYEEADKVLVIDADFAEVPSSATAEELLLRVRLCGWMRRLWTLEEGILSGDRLYLQLQDRAISLYKLLVDLPSSLYHRIGKEMCNTILRDLPLLHRGQIPDLSRFAIPLQLRTSSKTGDEVLCLASLMGLELDTIYDIPTIDGKMRWVYQSIGKISANVLFVKGQKLKGGARWAPKSFMANEDRLLLAIDPPPEVESVNATVTEFGLRFASRGSFVALEPDEQLKKAFYFQDYESRELMECEWIDTEQEIDAFTNIMATHGPGNDRQAQGRYALIFSPAEIFSDRAALVLVEQEVENVLCGRYISPCSLRKPIHSTSFGQDDILATEHIPLSTTWCIN